MGNRRIKENLEGGNSIQPWESLLLICNSLTELSVCCVGLLRLCYINNAFKSNIKIKGGSVSIVWGLLVKSYPLVALSY